MTIIESPRTRSDREEREAAERKAAELEQRKAAEADHARQTQQAARFDAAARALPDALFADDPNLKAMRDEATAAQRRLESLPKFVSHEQLRRTIAELTAKTTNALCSKALQLAAIDDALAGDLDFPRSAAVRRQIDETIEKLKAAQAAERALIGEGPKTYTTLKLQAREAANAVEQALHERKRQYLLANPQPAGDGK